MKTKNDLFYEFCNNFCLTISSVKIYCRRSGNKQYDDLYAYIDQYNYYKHELSIKDGTYITSEGYLNITKENTIKKMNYYLSKNRKKLIKQYNLNF